MRPPYSRLPLFATVALLAACGGSDIAAPPTQKTENDLFMDAARTAWTFVANNTQQSTGLAQAHYTFQYVTTWDIASQIAATYSAHELGIIDDPSYDSRITQILSTLNT